MSVKMTENKIVIRVTLDHIEDLEEDAENSRKDVADLNDEQSDYNVVKDSEIKYLVQEKENFNKKVKAKKEILVKDIANTAAKIKSLMEMLPTRNHGQDIDGKGTPEEVRVEGGKIPQGLKTVV